MPQTARWRGVATSRWFRWVSRLMTAAVCGVAALNGVGPALQAAYHGQRALRDVDPAQADMDRQVEQTAYLVREVDRLVPAGTRVEIRQPEGVDFVWWMRLFEASALNGLTVADRGDVRLSCVPDGAAPYGVRLDILTVRA
ncbi:hypothetical protein Drose_21815 [Dactylosporangium roseum]|uniref:Uncharacterized protein n=1 Tax=Dactylosporangium roseum TaxID=47989 RepID=A0ABY5YVX8_9ACTN|nr:hypothetical protein [Dactylosporangium roseum]UWZ33905.1 hypothetical protein Drose_21815 [Dactylosporangium roseum]